MVNESPSPVVPQTNPPATPLRCRKSACRSITSRSTLQSAFIAVSGAATKPSMCFFIIASHCS